MDAPGAAMGQLSTEDCLKLIRQMAKSGITRIELTGGELGGDFHATGFSIVGHLDVGGPVAAIADDAYGERRQLVGHGREASTVSGGMTGCAVSKARRKKRLKR